MIFKSISRGLLAAILLVAVVGVLVADDDEDELENRFPGGAALKTDRQMERLLAQAEKYANEGRYDLATIVWQKVLEESADILVTRDGRKYTSLTEAVEQTIGKLQVTGRQVYRITADGEAKALLAEGEKNGKQEDAMTTVVRKYFLSSHGDDAAYKLGCIALDRYDFVGASQMFTKILTKHPDPSMSKADVWLRLAVAAAHVGDSASATRAIKEVQNSTAAKPSDEIIEAVSRDVERLSGANVAVSSSSGDLNMYLGGASRRGHMKSLPEAVTRATLTRMWNYQFDIDFKKDTQAAASGIYIRRSGRQPNQPLKVAQSAKGLMQRWKNNNWSPAGQMLFFDGRIYFKTNNDLTCWSVAAESDEPIWRTAWLNDFQMDGHTALMYQMYRNMGMQGMTGKKPSSKSEVMLFGDRIHQAMSIAGGVIYSIEGRRVPRYGTATPAPVKQPTRFQYGVAPRRTRSNWLAAYDAKTGKAKWHVAVGSDADNADNSGLGFMDAPVPFGNFLLVPVSDSGTMFLYALDKSDGSTIWKTYLCDEPVGGTTPWSPIGVSVDGRDAYVVCGSGVVFAVDAVSGDIRFATRYTRDTKTGANPAFARFGAHMANQMKVLQGWSDDIAIPYGRQLIVLASDHDQLFAIDRRTGEMLWRTPRTPYDQPASYCLGVSGSGLFVAGKNMVRRYDLDKDGKLMWEVELEDSFGRGALTTDAVFMPVNDSIVRIDAATGKITSQVGVHLGNSDDPVGNLYSDGEKLWVLNGNSVSALTNKEQRLTVLNRRIKEGIAEAYIERMQLLAKDKNLDGAIADLIAAHELLAKSDSMDRAYSVLLDGMAEIKLIDQRPETALNLIGDKCIDPTAEQPVKVPTKELASQLQGVVYTALTKIHKSGAKGHAASVLKIAPAMEKYYQQSMARNALSTTLTNNDIVQLKAAVSGKSKLQTIIAAEALAQAAPEDAKSILGSLATSDDDDISHAAARGLAKLGDHSSLHAFAKLLESEDPRMRLRSFVALRSLTGQEIAFDAYGKADQRLASVKRWNEWIDGPGLAAELKLPLPDSEPMLGRTLIAYYRTSQVIELDSQRKQRWRKSDSGVWSVQGLPNGHRLIANYARRMVVEYDESGKEVWKKDNIPGNPFGAQRLPNGNTLVACGGGNQVIEYRPNGSIAWQQTVAGQPRSAQRLENGNTLVVCQSSSRVVELDTNGTVVWEATNMGSPMAAQRLENGNTLVVQLSSRRIVELNRKKEIVWKRENLNNPYHAQRLPNGNTIIVDNSGVIEYDPSGTKVWEQPGAGASCVSRF